MNVKYLKTTLSVFLILLIDQKICISAEQLDNQRISPRIAVITQSMPALQHVHTEGHLPVIEEINSKLLNSFGPINSTIRLATRTHNEISHLSAKYESYPEDIFYNHEKNQIQLTWKKTYFSIWGMKTKTKIKTMIFSLAKKSISDAKLPAHSPVPQQEHAPIAHRQQEPSHINWGVLTKSEAESAYSEAFNNLDQIYQINYYLETEEYTHLINDLKKYGLANLRFYYNADGSLYLLATWSNPQPKKYQFLRKR